MRAFILFVFYLSGVLSSPALAAGKAEHIVVIVWDGMRPDFVGEQHTPTLHKLAQEGAFFQNHHPVYLSATEVNGTALATGAYPARSGIMANREYRPRINSLKPLQTESNEVIRVGDRLTGGRYLKRATVAEILQAQGQKTAIAGTKPVTRLHDRAERTDHALNLGVNLSAESTQPETIWASLTNALGPYPKSVRPNAARDEWTTRALIDSFWANETPRFSLLWLSEPDYSQHDHGPGSETALAALKSSDDNLARVLRELDRRGLREKTDIFIVSDHGFSTISERVDVAKTLQDGGFNAFREFKKPPVKNDILVAGNGGSVLFYVIGRDSKLTRKLVTFLQTQNSSGVIYTRQRMPGTFSLRQANIHTEDAPDVVLSMRWSSDLSSSGVPGRVFVDREHTSTNALLGTHVTMSRFDLRNTLIAAGPDIRRGVVSALPSGNVDLAPTILWILGVKPPKRMDGRVLTEALTIAGPEVGKPKNTRIEAVNQQSDFVWRQYLKRTELNGVVYLDEGNGSTAPE